MTRKKVVQKKNKLYWSVLFIVEGCTETNYIRTLNAIFRCGYKVINCQGGGARGVLQQAKKIIKNNVDIYSHFVVIFDSDADFNNENLKKEIKGEIIICEPCFENWLLSHFQKPIFKQQKCENSIEILQKHIANYEKNKCNQLEKYISQGNFKIATENYIEIGKIFQKFYSQN